MSIVGDHPESGVRFVLERPYEGGPPWKYTGDSTTAPTALKRPPGFENLPTVAETVPLASTTAVKANRASGVNASPVYLQGGPPS